MSSSFKHITPQLDWRTCTIQACISLLSTLTFAVPFLQRVHTNPMTSQGYAVALDHWKACDQLLTKHHDAVNDCAFVRFYFTKTVY